MVFIELVEGASEGGEKKAKKAKKAAKPEAEATAG